MRLIDADALDSKLFSDGFFGGLSGALNGYKTRRKFTIGEFRTILKQAPTIEPTIKQGEWVEDIDEMECPECGSKWNYCDNNTERFNFCPHCGADMRAKAEI